MNHGTSHLIWMGVAFVALLVIGKVVGVGLFLLFPLFCFFMMAAMMLGMGMGHGDDKHKH
jgi:hypothetical protein